MDEHFKPIPEGILNAWDSLSWQLRARLKAFGPTPSPLTRDDFTDEEWRQLPFQRRARILATTSMQAEENLNLPE